MWLGTFCPRCGRMETKTTQTFDLSNADIKEAIAEWIENKFGVGKPLTVTLDTKVQYSGFGNCDYIPVISAKREV